MSRATKILDFLYLGGYGDALRERNSRELEVTHILNVKESAKYGEDDGIVSLHVPLSDYGQTDLRAALPKCFEFIENAKRSDGRILAHCRSGQNRSCAVVVGYLTFVHGLTLKASWELVSDLRPVVSICEPYWIQLEALEKEWKQESTFAFSELQQQLLAALAAYQK